MPHAIAHFLYKQAKVINDQRKEQILTSIHARTSVSSNIFQCLQNAYPLLMHAVYQAAVYFRLPSDLEKPLNEDFVSLIGVKNFIHATLLI